MTHPFIYEYSIVLGIFQDVSIQFLVGELPDVIDVRSAMLVVAGYKTQQGFCLAPVLLFNLLFDKEPNTK